MKERLTDHLGKRRLDLRMLRRDPAAHLGADAAALLNREKGRSEPPIRRARRGGSRPVSWPTSSAAVFDSPTLFNLGVSKLTVSLVV